MVETLQAAMLVNLHSRRGARLYERALRSLRDGGVDLGLARGVRRPAKLPVEVDAAVAGGYDPVIVGGGDGSISSSLGALAYRPVTLGILPLGTSNTLARTLGIPLGLQGAVDVITGGGPVDVDLGRANDHYFVNSLSLGFSVCAARELTRESKRRVGFLAYPLAAGKAFLKSQPFRATIVAHGQSLQLPTRQLVVANGAYMLGVLRVGPGAAINNHRLAVFALEGASRLQLLRRSFWLALGLHADDPRAHYFAAQELTVIADPPQPMDVDGELLGTTPVTVAVAPEALRVLAPPGFQETPHPDFRSIPWKPKVGQTPSLTKDTGVSIDLYELGLVPAPPGGPRPGPRPRPEGEGRPHNADHHRDSP